MELNDDCFQNDGHLPSRTDIQDIREALEDLRK